VKRISCSRCLRPSSACLCAVLPQHPLDNHWRIHILQHRQEQAHALNTARIAVLGLSQCQLHVVSDAAVETTLSPALMAELAGAFLIYPGPESTNVNELTRNETAGRPFVLLDASWRKSRRMLLSSPWLQTLPRISFGTQAESRYRIRRQPAASHCSTLEALCAVLGTIAGDHDKYAPLLATMDLMVDQQITHMGAAVFRHNYSESARGKQRNESTEPEISTAETDLTVPDA
jgi:DTW domain-containing protein